MNYPRTSRLVWVVYSCTIRDMDINEWIAETTGSASWRTIAARLGTTHPTIQRRIKNDTASAVVEIAAEYGANPVVGLLAAGCISLEDVQAAARQATIDDYSDLELAQKVVERIAARSDSPLATVTEFPSNDRVPPRPADHEDDGTVLDWNPAWNDGIAADSSPDEDAGREEAGADPLA